MNPEIMQIEEEWARLVALAEACALAKGLDPTMVRAICQVESDWNPWAARHEPAWKWLWYPRENADQLHLTQPTEQVCQMTSWGLMQIMGAVARERGFTGHLTALCKPEVGLEYGCRQLVWLRTFAGDDADLIAAYNGGRGSMKKLPSGMYPNQRYVDKVHRAMIALRGLQS